MPVNTGDTRDVGSIPGLGRSSGEGNDNHFSILAWTILWTEEPACYSLWGHQESDMTQRLNNNNAESYTTRETKKGKFVFDFRCDYVSHKKTIHVLEFTDITGSPNAGMVLYLVKI